MDFLIIDADQCSMDVFAAEDISGAYEKAGLKRGQVDFGCLGPKPGGGTVNIVVYEFGLRKPPHQGRYFSIGQALYEGNAILFAADDKGETVSLDVAPLVTFYRSAIAAEQAIERGDIMRPEMSLNGEVLWQWKGS